MQKRHHCWSWKQGIPMVYKPWAAPSFCTEPTDDSDKSLHASSLGPSLWSSEITPYEFLNRGGMKDFAKRAFGTWALGCVRSCTSKGPCLRELSKLSLGYEMCLVLADMIYSICQNHKGKQLQVNKYMVLTNPCRCWIDETTSPPLNPLLLLCIRRHGSLYCHPLKSPVQCSAPLLVSR